ncbi:MAG: hypothetical protein VXW65_01980 [Pseudomonadota bacterium]|nr:hypothetical protein [Pseudomonadota bacterium]
MSKQTSIFMVFSGEAATPVIIEPSGTGSVYTYRAYGTAGQTVEVRGGFAGDDWEDMETIVTLTVGGTQSAVLQHTWPVLAVQGDARVKIARGAA